MIGPELIGNQIYFDTPAETELTNAEIVLVDSTHDSFDFYPYAYTATVDEFKDEHIYGSGTQAQVTFKSQMRLTLGVFLTGDAEKGAYLVQVEGSTVLHGATSTIPFYVIGRTAASSVTSSKAGTANQSSYVKLIPSCSEIEYSGNQKVSCNQTIIVEPEATNDYPIFFAICFQASGADAVADYFSSLSIRKYTEQIRTYSPVGR